MAANWLTANDPRLADLWPAALDHSEESLEVYLEAAAGQCEEYLGEQRLALAEVTPSNWLLAQALQARSLATSAAVNHDGEIGSFGDSFSVFPMDWKVRNLLRPKTTIGIA